MQKIYKTNRIVMCMSNFNNYNKIINNSLKNGNLKKTMIVASITDKYSTYEQLKENYDIPVFYLDKSGISKDKYNEILKMKINQFNHNTFNELYNINNALNLSKLKKINNIRLMVNNINIDNIHKDFIKHDIIDYKDIPIYNSDNLEIFTKRLTEQEQECILHVLQKFEKLL